MEIFLFNVASFIVIISIIVFVHEFGHYWVAKKSGVKIDSFSIGFGREIFGWNDKSGTRWKISLVPMGGYVKMFGDEGAASTPDEEKLSTLTPEEEKQTFHGKPLWVKSLIVFAGPGINFLFAIIIFAFMFAFMGKGYTTPELGEIMKGGAAEEAGLQPGDVITELNGTSIDTFEEMRDIIVLHPDIKLDMILLRNGQETAGSITPRPREITSAFDDKARVGYIGVTPAGNREYKELSVLSSINESIAETYSITERTLQAIKQIIFGQRSVRELSGIIRIGDYSGKAVRKSIDQGFYIIFWFMAVLSINLGLINLFPIPMLDGGHLLFYGIEAIRRKPLPQKAQEIFFRFGFAALITLMAMALFNDLRHFGLFGG